MVRTLSGQVRNPPSVPWRTIASHSVRGLLSGVGPALAAMIGESTPPRTNPPPSTGLNLGGDRGWQPKPQGAYAPSPPQVTAPRTRYARVGAPPRPVLPDFSGITGALAQAQQSAVDSLGSLEGQYQEQLAALRSQYALAETPHEKAQIQAALKNLAAQRKAGQQVVKKAYGAAIRGSKKSAKQVRKAGKKAGKQTQKSFSKAAQEAKKLVQESEASFADSGLGLDSGGLSGEAKEIAKELVKEGARQAAFARNQDRGAANEIRYLGESMRGERAAQQGELQRIATALSAQAQAQHDAQVAARINAERSQLAQAQQALAAMFTQRGFGLQDQLQQINLQGASLGADLAAQQAGVFNDWRNQVWQTRAGNQQSRIDASNATRQQQFGLDSARQASIFQAQLEEYQRKQEEKRRAQSGGLAQILAAAQQTVR